MNFPRHTGRNGWLLTIALLLGLTFALGANAAVNPDKQMSKIGGLAHTAFPGVNRHRFWHAVHAFLTTPTRVDLAGGAAAAAH